MKVPRICPRCNENFIPSNENPGKYPGAISRADDKTEICSMCGTEEAVEVYAAGGCTALSDWPLGNRLT